MSEQLIDTDFEDDYESELTLEEQAIRREVEVVLSPDRQKTVNFLVDKLMIACDRLTGNPLRPYQTPFARRMFESMIISDGASLTALFSRQCLDGDTIVFRRDGTAVRLKDHEDSWSTGVKPTKRYKVRGGSEIVATDNHPVMTPQGWVPAGALRTGDLVSIAAGVEAKGKVDPGILTARLLGYFATDGTWSAKQSAKFTNIRELYLAEFASMMQDAFGVTVKRYAKGNGADLLITGSSRGNPFRDYLKTLGWDDRFPTQVFSWTRETQAEFINRAWSGDGCISMKKSGPDIFLACGNSEVNARYWQALLLHFGISSTVKREVMAKGTGTFHRLIVSGGARSVRAFFQAFGLIFGKEKQSRAALDYFDAKAALPSGKGRAERAVNKYWSTGPDGEELAWTRIVAIEDAGEREVFDVRYEGKGWFIAQGVQVHNSGKTEVVANVVATCMLFFPRLAPFYPEFLEKYAREGVQVGAFAPVEEQADNLFGRIVAVLQSDNCKAMLMDPEIDDRVRGRGSVVWLQNCKSAVRKTTCHPKAKIEGRHYHMILIDEAQDADTKTVNKSVTPMGTATEATMVYTGTPTYNINFFYDQIQKNKRAILGRGKVRQDHFQADWKLVAKYVPAYKRSTLRTMENIGEDSDEFRLNYKLEWLLDKGMFTTEEMFTKLSDVSVQSLEHDWPYSPVVAGIDCGRRQDKTIVTVVWVDWDHPDNFGFYEHRVINWLDLEGLDWEEQYYRITEFLSHYNVYAVGVDTGGIGDVVKQRLSLLMPHTTFVECMDSVKEQSDRFKYMKMLMERQRVIWPGGSRVKRLKCWQRFKQEMTDAEIEFKGPNIAVAAPKSRDAHDDYVDSLCDALSLTRDTSGIETAKRQTVVYGSPFFKSSRRR
jgi:hypothetical protein